MPGYRYGGTEFDAHLPIAEPTPRARPKQRDPDAPSKCGTNQGYDAHRRSKTPICQPCRDAHNAYKRDWKRRKKAGLVKTGWTTAKCGTMAGVASHYRHAVPVCNPCRDVSRARAKELRAAKKAAA